MKKIFLMTVLLAAILAVPHSLAGIARQAEDPGVLLRAAMEREEVDGDLQAAIALYKQIVAKHSAESAIAAKAQLRIGICYEKLGNAEAVKAYEAVLSRFPKEAEAVAEARARLASLRRDEPAGLTVTRLLPPGVFMMYPVLSPDGTKAAGTVFDRPEAEGENIAVYDLATGKMKLITDYTYSPDSREAYTAVWSPDSREIVFWARVLKTSIEELWISSLAGKPRLLLANPNGRLTPLDWLPDGSAVVAFLEKENHVASLGLVSVKDGSFREICPLLRAASQYGQHGILANASPDGRLIVFSDGPLDGQLDIFVISVDGLAKAPLIDQPGDDRQPRWSPDGRHVAFLSNRHGNWALWGVVVKEGKSEGPPFMILEGMEDAELSTWTKKGLLFWTEVRAMEIYIQEIDPLNHSALGKPRVLNHTAGDWFVGPSWSPDGRYLHFKRYADGKSELMIMPSDGGEPRNYKMFSHATKVRGGYGAWLPDSSSMGIIFWDIEKQLFFSHPDLKTGEWKTRSIPAGENFSGFNPIAWGRDGKSFFSFKKEEDGVEAGLVEHDLETGRERYLFRAKSGEDYDYIPIRISRDYSQLAWDKGGTIVLADVETGRTESLEFDAKKQLFCPSWAPDGKHLVAKGRPEGENDVNELYIVSLNDGNFKSLDIRRYLPSGKARIQNSPDWSPDGRKIAFDLWTFRPEAKLIRNVIPEK
jgi:Tol biopolymer transport system component